MYHLGQKFVITQHYRPELIGSIWQIKRKPGQDRVWLARPGSDQNFSLSVRVGDEQNISEVDFHMMRGSGTFVLYVRRVKVHYEAR